jgi:hypothetical protein
MLEIKTLTLEELKKRAAEGSLVGVFKVSNDDYHAGPGISKSGLDQVNRSPAHYKAWLESPDEQTAAMAFGSAVHVGVLEPELFDSLYAVIPVCDRRTKEGKAIYAEFEAQLGARKPLHRDDALRITAIRESVSRHAQAATLLKSPYKELAFYWVDQETGVLCKTKPDAIAGNGLLVDVKTTADASPSEFRRKIANYRYDVQLAMQIAGIREALTQSGLLSATDSVYRALLCDLPVLLAVETEAPHQVALYSIPEAWLESGLAEFRRNLCTYAECAKTGEFPGYSPDIVTLTQPAWAVKGDPL